VKPLDAAEVRLIALNELLEVAIRKAGLRRVQGEGAREQGRNKGETDPA
jgi:hypothetical protein